jgi:hypothetical protein
LLINHKICVIYKFISLALILGLLGLIVQACGGNENDTNSSTTTEDTSPTISIFPTSSASGATVTINGIRFAAYASGMVWFDTNGNGALDIGEPSVPATAGSNGIFTVTLTVPPGVASGKYDIKANVPFGPPTEASATFTVMPATITLFPTGGSSGVNVTIAGNGFAASAEGMVWFDTNGNGALDTGEPSTPATAGNNDTFTVALTVPPGVAPDKYNIKADVPLGTPLEASATFTVLPATITIAPTGDSSGANVTVTGTGFAAYAEGMVWFDINGNGALDTGEPSAKETVAGDGTFTATLTVPPGVAPDKYNIKADVPFGPPMEASATFTVLPAMMILSPTGGVSGSNVTVTGSGFAAHAGGVVWFDTNGNGALDNGESSVQTTAGSNGTFTVTLTVPPGVAPGKCSIKADVPLGSPVEASETFTVLKQ